MTPEHPEQTAVLATLGGTDHRARWAPHARGALDALRPEPVDVVLLDITDPDSPGADTLGELKCDSAVWHVPVIVLGSPERLGQVVRCIELGAKDFLLEPLPPHPGQSPPQRLLGPAAPAEGGAPGRDLEGQQPVKRLDWPLVGREPELRLLTGLMRSGTHRAVDRGRGGQDAPAARMPDRGRPVGAPDGPSGRHPLGGEPPVRRPRPAPAPAQPGGAGCGGRPGRVPASLLQRAHRPFRGDRFVLGVDDPTCSTTPPPPLVHHLAGTGVDFVVVTVRIGESPPDPVVALWKDGLAERLGPGRCQLRRHRGAPRSGPRRAHRPGCPGPPVAAQPRQHAVPARARRRGHGHGRSGRRRGPVAPEWPAHPVRPPRRTGGNPSGRSHRPGAAPPRGGRPRGTPRFRRAAHGLLAGLRALARRPPAGSLKLSTTGGILDGILGGRLSTGVPTLRNTVPLSRAARLGVRSSRLSGHADSGASCHPDTYRIGALHSAHSLPLCSI